MNKGNFNIQLGAYLEKKMKGDEKPSFYVFGTGSTIDLDRQGDILSEKALLKMKSIAGEKKIPVFGDHEHSWKNTMGYIESSDVNNGEWNVSIKLEDPDFNEDSEMLINKMEHGTPIGLSIGGRVPEGATRFEKTNSGTVRIVDDIELYELSFVGIPANQNGSVISYISKSLGDEMTEEIKQTEQPVVEEKPVEVVQPVAEEKPVEQVEAKTEEQPVQEEVKESSVEETFVTKKEFLEMKKTVIEEVAKELAKIKAESKAIVDDSLEAKQIDNTNKESEDETLLKKIMEKM